MRGQLATVWNYRHFWLSLAGMDLRVRYRRSLLGVGWSLLNPIIMTIVFCVAFASWMGNGDWRASAPFYLAGLAVWEFIKQSALQGALTFSRNESYIRQSPLPLAIYTLRTSLGIAVHFAIAIVLAIVAASVLNRDDWTLPFQALGAVMPGAFLLLVFGWAIATLFAVGNTYFHDTLHLAETGFGIGLFLTPIIYPKERLIERGLGFVADLNPIVAFLDVLREPIITGQMPSLIAFERVFGLTIVALALALFTLRRTERRVIFHL